MKFPEKLWKIVNECVTGAIGWGMDGDRIFIDYEKFELEYLGKELGFKTKNVISFVRQLNLYGFRKCNRYTDVHEFRHPHFIRGRPDLVKSVRRKLGYRASINTEKMETPMESKGNVSVNTSPSTNPTVPGSSISNIYWNQMQYYCMLYTNWLRSHGHGFFKDSEDFNSANDGVRETKSSTNSRDSACQSSASRVNNNIVYVPIPVPAQYGWPLAMMGNDMDTSSEDSSSSDENADENKEDAILACD